MRPEEKNIEKYERKQEPKLESLDAITFDEAGVSGNNTLDVDGILQSLDKIPTGTSVVEPKEQEITTAPVSPTLTNTMNNMGSISELNQINNHDT
eukprot:UN14029